MQLQGCSESFDATPDDIPDVPSLFLATWLRLLGAYLFWVAQPSKSSQRVAEEDANFEADVRTCGDEVDLMSSTTGATTVRKSLRFH